MKQDKNATRPSGVSRRTVVKGAAWAVPAVAIAGSAKAVAASEPVVVSYGGGACKHPGEPKWYHFIFCFDNTSAASITVSLTKMNVNGVERPTLPTSVTIPADTELCYFVDGGLFSDSANGTATLYYSYTYLGNLVEGDIQTSFNSLPPCGTGADPCGSTNPKSDPPHSPDPVAPCF